MGKQSIFAGFVCAAIALAVAWAWAGRRFLEKYPVGWTTADWSINDTYLLGAATVFSAFFVTLFFAPGSRKKEVSFPIDRPTALLACVNIAILFLALWLMMSAPDYFARNIDELGTIALGQEFSILIAVVLLGLTARNLHIGSDTKLFGIPVWFVASLMAAAVFLLLMEEISWGQHIIGWATPNYFDGNLQNETNLHNFYTHRFELLYYSGAIGCFVLLPFLMHRYDFKWLESIRFFVPSVGFGIAALPLAGHMFLSWSIMAFQVYFLIAICLSLLVMNHTSGMQRLAYTTIPFSMVVTQVFFLEHGPNLIRTFELTETRELAISVTLLAYSIWLYAKSRALVGAHKGEAQLSNQALKTG